MRKIFPIIFFIFISFCFFSCKDSVTNPSSPVSYDTSITYTDSNGVVLGGDLTDWCSHCLGTSCYSLRPVYPNPVTDSFAINYEVGTTIPVKLFYLNSTDTVFLVNSIQSAGSYSINLSAAHYNLHNTYRKLYIQSNGFYCSGDIKFR